MTTQDAISLSVSGMSCASCAGRVDKAIRDLEGVSDVSVNLASETVRLRVATPDRLADVVTTLAERGYPATTATTTLNIGSMS